MTNFEELKEIYEKTPSVYNRQNMERAILPGMDAEIEYLISLRTPEGNVGFQKAVEEYEVAREELTQAWKDFREGLVSQGVARSVTDKSSNLKRDLEGHKNETARLLEMHTVPTFTEWEGDTLGKTHKVSDFEPNTPEWLQTRLDTIGGSDVGKLYGMLIQTDKWAIPNFEELVKEKTEGIEVTLQPSITYKPWFWRGNVWEPHILAQFLQENPEIKGYHTKAQWKFGEFQQINLDGVMEDGIIEVKTSGSRFEWRSGIPISYRAQVLYYLATLNGNDPKKAKFTHAYIVCKIHDSEKLLVKEIEHTEPINPKGGINMYEFMPTVREFWLSCQGLLDKRE